MLLRLIISTIKQLNFLFLFIPNSTITLSKVYPRRTIDKAFILQSYFLDALLKHSNKAADKSLNLFDECAARCVHLSHQEEECTSSS